MKNSRCLPFVFIVTYNTAYTRKVLKVCNFIGVKIHVENSLTIFDERFKNILEDSILIVCCAPIITHTNYILKWTIKYDYFSLVNKTRWKQPCKTKLYILNCPISIIDLSKHHHKISFSADTIEYKGCYFNTKRIATTVSPITVLTFKTPVFAVFC
jgi:hypothetical protein